MKRKRDHLEHPGVDGMILQWTFKTKLGESILGSLGSGYEPVE
jgi:hypothetical protein